MNKLFTTSVRKIWERWERDPFSIMVIPHTITPDPDFALSSKEETVALGDICNANRIGKIFGNPDYDISRKDGANASANKTKTVIGNSQQLGNYAFFLRPKNAGTWWMGSAWDYRKKWASFSNWEVCAFMLTNFGDPTCWTSGKAGKGGFNPPSGRFEACNNQVYAKMPMFYGANVEGPTMPYRLFSQYLLSFQVKTKLRGPLDVNVPSHPSLFNYKNMAVIGPWWLYAPKNVVKLAAPKLLTSEPTSDYLTVSDALQDESAATANAIAVRLPMLIANRDAIPKPETEKDLSPELKWRNKQITDAKRRIEKAIADDKALFARTGTKACTYYGSNDLPENVNYPNVVRDLWCDDPKSVGLARQASPMQGTPRQPKPAKKTATKKSKPAKTPTPKPSGRELKTVKDVSALQSDGGVIDVQNISRDGIIFGVENNAYIPAVSYQLDKVVPQKVWAMPDSRAGSMLRAIGMRHGGRGVDFSAYPELAKRVRTLRGLLENVTATISDTGAVRLEMRVSQWRQPPYEIFGNRRRRVEIFDLEKQDIARVMDPIIAALKTPKSTKEKTAAKKTAKKKVSKTAAPKKKAAKKAAAKRKTKAVYTAISGNPENEDDRLFVYFERKASLAEAIADYSRQLGTRPRGATTGIKWFELPTETRIVEWTPEGDENQWFEWEEANPARCRRDQIEKAVKDASKTAAPTALRKRGIEMTKTQENKVAQIETTLGPGAVDVKEDGDTVAITIKLSDPIHIAANEGKNRSTVTGKASDLDGLLSTLEANVSALPAAHGIKSAAPKKTAKKKASKTTEASKKAPKKVAKKKAAKKAPKKSKAENQRAVAIKMEEISSKALAKKTAAKKTSLAKLAREGVGALDWFVLQTLVALDKAKNPKQVFSKMNPVMRQNLESYARTKGYFIDSDYRLTDLGSAIAKRYAASSMGKNTKGIDPLDGVSCFEALHALQTGTNAYGAGVMPRPTQSQLQKCGLIARSGRAYKITPKGRAVLKALGKTRTVAARKALRIYLRDVGKFRVISYKTKNLDLALNRAAKIVSEDLLKDISSGAVSISRKKGKPITKNVYRGDRVIATVMEPFADRFAVSGSVRKTGKNTTATVGLEDVCRSVQGVARKRRKSEGIGKAKTRDYIMKLAATRKGK